MSRLVMMDQYHLTVLAPAGLRQPHRRRISKVLNRARFRQELARAVRAVFAKYPELSRVHVSVSC
jgi:hypothetical protein